MGIQQNYYSAKVKEYTKMEFVMRLEGISVISVALPKRYGA